MNSCEKKSLTVVIPAYNEAQSLPLLLPGLLRYTQDKNYRVLIVEDGSTDNSRGILEQFSGEGNLKVIHHKMNRGYGGALKSGIEAVDTEYMVTIDADGQHYLEDIDKLAEVMIFNDADMVVGSRKGQHSASLYRGLGKSLLRCVAKLLMPIPIFDINSGMKIYRTDLARQYIHLLPDSMSFSDVITLVFISNKNRVLETPIGIKERIAGKSTIGTMTALDTLKEIMNVIVLFNPMKIFLPTALLFILVGLWWGIPIILKGGGVTPGMSLLITMGIFSFLLGLIAEQLSRIRRNSKRSYF
ncbi:MAG TPA: glycosyltransferase family 2 protein [Candidatus Deferrimicrobium sp.]|nr:glycosyltransferase family 2 protein [Candidatus Deferrimicrobium sp.]